MARSLAGQLPYFQPSVIHLRPYNALSAELPVNNLREGLTKPKRLRDAVPESLTGLVTALPEVKKGAAAAAAKPAALGPQTDLPPVLAGPGRYCI